ncbi:MAG TPA: hypothetical protein PKA88_07685 [Polyangiaceae bacterium]|nr:hypothetical protein [Polyangiaceae bacterium]
MGLKSAASSLGGVLGPLLVTVTSGVLTPMGVFTSAAGLVTAIFAMNAFGDLSELCLYRTEESGTF